MAKTTFELSQLATVSISHITERDAELLQKDVGASAPGLIVYDLDADGWLILVDATHMDEVGYSEAFQALVRAIYKTADWLKLERDGPVVDGFQTFNWL